MTESELELIKAAYAEGSKRALLEAGYAEKVAHEESATYTDRFFEKEAVTLKWIKKVLGKKNLKMFDKGTGSKIDKYPHTDMRLLSGEKYGPVRTQQEWQKEIAKAINTGKKKNLKATNKAVNKMFE